MISRVLLRRELGASVVFLFIFVLKRILIDWRIYAFLGYILGNLFIILFLGDLNEFQSQMFNN